MITQVADAQQVVTLGIGEQHADFVHHHTTGLFELFKSWFGPVASLWAKLDDQTRAAYAAEWIALADAHNTTADGTCVIPSPYLQVVAVKA